MISSIIKKYKNRIAFATITSALSSAISISLLALVNQKINVESLDEIISSIPLFLGLIVLLFTISFYSQIVLAKLGTSFVFQLRKKLLSQINNVSYENLEKLGGHKVLASVTSDVSSIAGALTILPVFVVNFATIIFCLFYLADQSLALFTFLFFGLLIGVGLSVVIRQKGGDYFISLREKEDKLFAVFKTLIEGSKELNINRNRRDYFYREQAEPSIEDIRTTELRAKSYWILSDSIIRTLLFLILGSVVYIAHTLVVVETNILTSFIIFTTYLIGPIAFVQATTQSFLRARIGYQKIQALNITVDEIKANEPFVVTEKRWKTLVFDNVFYEYQGESDYQFSLGPLNLTIEQGECLFICGGNGSGKSTFAKILVGLYAVQNGRILLGGNTIQPSSLQAYRSLFSTIFSDFYLFEHVLDRDGKLVSQTEIEDQLKELELYEKVSVAEGKISTTKLSQGQRKRLAMLLAYAEDASIYLFDEWAADQDPTYREYFYTVLLPKFKARGKTLIVITHDDKYFDLADRLIKFENGNLVENFDQPIKEVALSV